MLSEFLKLIQDTAVKASGAQIVHADERTKHVFADGAMIQLPIAPDPRRHHFGSVESLCEFCGKYSAASVWHNPAEVVVVTDDNDRRDIGILVLDRSAPFALLETLGTRPLSQRDLVRILRHDLRNAGVEHVLSAVRRLEFKRKNDGSSNIQHGSESLGRSVEASVNSADAIPEFFNATVPVYSTPGADWHKTVYCTVEIDAANERFSVIPDADSLAKAIHDVQTDLHESLTGELDPTPVYYGSV